MVRRSGTGAGEDAAAHRPPRSPRPDNARVRVFGPLSVSVGGATLGARDFDGVKPRQLFEILVLARGRTVSKDRLADALWGEELPANTPATLEKYVSILRKRLTPAPLIETQPYGYRFAVEHADLDLDRFDELVEQARSLGPSKARLPLEMALSLVRGDVMEDDPYVGWAEEDRTAYAERVIRAHLDVAEAALACRDFSGGRAHAERALARDPLREEAFRTLIAASYAAGHQDDALRCYERCRARLDQELGVAPMPETKRLHDLVRHHADVSEVLPAPAWDDLPSAIDLRAPRVPLLGRSAELAAVVDAVQAGVSSSRYTVVHVVGLSGMGKSCLTQEVAGHVADVRVGRARCSRVERDLPFVPLAMALRGALPPDAPDPLGRVLSQLAPQTAEAGRLRALEELAGAAASNGPTLLILDDAQWADDATLTALSYLRHRCREAPLVLLKTFDPVHVPHDHPLASFRPDARVMLGPLSPEEVEVAGWPALYERTQGHPLLVAASIEARAQGRDEELPLRLSPWVLERALEAGEQAHRLLVTAAVLGRPFGPEELAPSAGGEVDEVVRQLEALCARGLLRSDEDGFCFAAPLLAEVLVHSISPARARLVRERLGAQRLRGVGS